MTDLKKLLIDTGHAINANNGQCELIEDVLCRVTTLICELNDPRKQYQKTGAIRVGRLLDMRPDDDDFPSLAAARVEAKQRAAKDKREVIAVWIGDDVDRVFTAGLELEPVPF